jgi:hypothetical protein
MALLVTSPGAKDYDILAIQEPWVNPFHPAIYCPASSPFQPIFAAQSKRSCLLVNRRLDSNKWNTTITGPDLCSIRLKSEDETVWVHSIYCQPPGSYNIEASQYDNPLEAIHNLLLSHPEDQYISVGDFNLHYPFWAGVRAPAAYTAADRLIEVMIDSGSG